MARWGFWRGWYGMSLMLLGIIFNGCEGSPQEPPAADSEARSSSAPAILLPESTEDNAPALPPSPAEPDASLAPSTPTPAASYGTVLAGKELGMVMTGVGPGVPGRSLDVLEGQILSFLPQLQEVYDREREQDPGLMGSLEVSLVIEPGGSVSDVRFPRTRVSGEKLVATVFDRIRTWTFPPAEGKVQLRYSLLFMPPGVDHASIFMWEKHLGSRTVVNRSGETPPSVAKTTVPVDTEEVTAPEPVRKPAPKVAAPKPAKRPAPPVSRRAETMGGSNDSYVLGWYRVVRPASIHTAPRDAADIVAQLQTGTLVRVVGVVAGEWLEIRSVNNRPPGFLRRGYARPTSDGQTG